MTELKLRVLEYVMPNKTQLRKTHVKSKVVYEQDYQETLTDTAHYKAEQCGFVPGYAQEEWVETENDIRAMLKLH